MQEIVNTEEIVAKAVNLFKQGYNCSQSVAMAFSERYGISEALMSRLGASFGGGIGRMRETCGAACGMFLLAGLEVDDCGSTPSPELKAKNYKVVQHLAEQFRKENGSLLCKELLGLTKKREDGTSAEVKIVATPEARTEEYYKKRPCVYMVESAVRIYCKYLEERMNDHS